MGRASQRFGILLIVYLALVGYALVAWLPSLVDGYHSLHQSSPRIATLYLALVALGLLILGGLSLWVFVRLLRNTLGKQRQQSRRAKDPSQLSSSQQKSELAENLAASRNFADDQGVSQELRSEVQQAITDLKHKQQSCQLELVAFGTISSGKSSLLNALAGRKVFSTNVVGGTTAIRSEIPWPGNDKVILVDTPGLAEVRGESRAAEAALAAKDADLVLLVVDGPLKDYEAELVSKLTEMEKRVVVCLNKEDWYDQQQQHQLVVQITQQLPEVAPEDIVPIRASQVSRTRVRVTPEGQEVQEEFQMSPDVEALAERLLHIVSRDGQDLLLANLLLQSRGLVDQAKHRVRSVLDQQAEEVINRHMWAAGGAAGINPFPLLDIAGGSAITVKMVLDLANIYKQPIDADMVVKILEQLGKNLIAMVGVTAATPALASGIGTLLKTVPGIGTIAGGLIQGLVQAVVTRWIGNVFVKYFQNEMKAPTGGMAELAREEWQQITSADSLKKIVQLGRRELESRLQQEERV